MFCYLYPFSHIGKLVKILYSSKASEEKQTEIHVYL